MSVAFQIAYPPKALKAAGEAAVAVIGAPVAEVRFAEGTGWASAALPAEKV